MKYAHRSTFVIAAAAALAACAIPTSSSEDVGQAKAAVTATGMNASLTVAWSNSQQVFLMGTVTNNTSNPASNWQVAIALNNSTLNQGINGAEANIINGSVVFSPNQNSQGPLGVGQSTTFTFSVRPTSTNNFLPTVSTVDGVANGTFGVGSAATGIDAIAQAAATAALNVAAAYENNEPASDGDPNYAQYDGLIWSAQSYVISGNTIAFDPNVPGYAFISEAAKAELAFAQLDPSVASYLVDGLQSCFNDSSGSYVYNFRAGVLKGFTSNTTTTGTIGGVIPPAGAYTPPGYNENSVIDNYSTVGLGKSGTTITSTLTSTRSPSSAQDFWFGLLTYTSLSSFPNSGTVARKYAGSGNQFACSPFNGPGGTPNPSFTISLNGQSVPARFQGVGQQCQNGCTSTIVIDPVAYMTPGVQYNAQGNELGPQINPFALNPSAVYAISQNDAIWAVETSGGTQTWGQFIIPVTLFGTTKYQFLDLGTIPQGWSSNQ